MPACERASPRPHKKHLSRSFFAVGINITALQLKYGRLHRCWKALEATGSFLLVPHISNKNLLQEKKV